MTHERYCELLSALPEDMLADIAIDLDAKELRLPKLPKWKASVVAVQMTFVPWRDLVIYGGKA